MKQKPEAFTKLKQMYRTSELPVSIRGKDFGLTELRIIHQCIEEYFEYGRTRISKEICKRLDWRQPNGWLKDRACRDVLIRLEDSGLVELPKSKHNVVTRTKAKRQSLDIDALALDTTVNSLERDLTLVLAKGNKFEHIWNYVVDTYHYLGHKVTVGRCLKYLIYSDDILLSAISFSSPSWQVQSRNNVLRKLGMEPSEFRDLVINNSRFLILPNIRIRNLATQILSVATKQVYKDWLWYYSLSPQIVETFIDRTKFTGASYHAANWITVGITKGYSKRGLHYRNGQQPKQVLLYGLTKRYRNRLLNLRKLGEL